MVIHSHSSVPQVKQYLHIGYMAMAPEFSKPFFFFLLFGLFAMKFDNRFSRGCGAFLLSMAVLMGVGYLIK